MADEPMRQVSYIILLAIKGGFAANPYNLKMIYRWSWSQNLCLVQEGSNRHGMK